MSLLFVLVYSLTGCGLIMRRAVIAYIAVNAAFAPDTVEIQINRSFIRKFKDRVVMYTTFTVDKAMGSALPNELDGDMHFAGRAPQVALPIVAEIANAGDEQAAVALVHAAEGAGTTLGISGVWRIWPEHAGSTPEQQGKPLLALDSYKPDHVFEIHPITSINGLQLHGFTPVKNFKPGGAQRTFGIFERVPCTLKVKARTISIVTATGLYNDAEFIMELAPEPQIVVADGRFVIASARDMEGNVLVKRLRMVFVKGTPPERAVRVLKSGDRLHVYGIPRFDFAEISRRVRDGRRNPAALIGRLPYEMVILGVYPN